MADSPLPDDGILTSAFYDANIRQQVITTCTSTTRPTAVNGRMIYETDTGIERVYAGDYSQWVELTRTGPWVSYTPTLTQNTAVAKTVNYSKYQRNGKLVSWAFSLTPTATGTAGYAVTLTLPLTAYQNPGVYGPGAIYHNPTKYAGCWQNTSTTTIVLTGDWSGVNSWGVSPSLAIGTGTEIRGQINYLIANYTP